MSENEHKKLGDNPKDALEQYLTYLYHGYYDWYVRSVTRNYLLWLATQTTAIAAGFGASILAGLADASWYNGFHIGRVLLVMLPALGSLAATIAVQTRAQGNWALRERGRRKFQYLVDEGRRRFGSAKTPEEYAALHEFLVNEARKIEAEQSERFFAQIPDFARLDARAGRVANKN